MLYYKHKETGEVFAYEKFDLEAIVSITKLERELQQAQTTLARDEQTENQMSASQAVYQAQAALDSVNLVYFKIRDNLAGCTQMTRTEIEEYLNPELTVKQLEAQVREKRDKMLTEADHQINILDDVMQDSSAWRAYRQMLREVPEQEGFPHNVAFPEIPERV